MTYPEWTDIRNSNFVRTRFFPLIDEDTPTFMGLPLATSPGRPPWRRRGHHRRALRRRLEQYAGVGKSEWLAGPKRVRQQSIRYGSGYVQDFDLDVFEHLRVVDFGDAEIPPEANEKPTVENILRAQAAVEEKVNEVLDAGALPIVIGQNSPCGSYAIAKPIAERTHGNVGVISLDTHWDAQPIDRLTMDARIAGAASWKRKMYEFHENITVANLVEIGERGMLEDKEIGPRVPQAGGALLSHVEGSDRARHRRPVPRAAPRLRRHRRRLRRTSTWMSWAAPGPPPGDILGELAEPIGMTDYEVIRLAFEIGKRGLSGLSFICIPPGSAVVYRAIVYVIMYLLAGRVLTGK